MDNKINQGIDAGITKIVTAINAKGKFFKIKIPRSDECWQPKLDYIKSLRDHCKGQNKGS